jgi:Kelch motif/Galactose oxidase, central domain
MHFLLRRKPLVGSAVAIVVSAACFALGLGAQVPQNVGTWAPLGATPNARIGAAAIALPDGRTLIVGGRVSEGSTTDSVVAFNPATNETVAIGHLIGPREGHTATLLKDGRVLVAGGTMDGVISTDLEIFDVVSGSSMLAGSLIQPRTSHAAALLHDGQVLIVGGATIGTDVLASAELFDPETSTVTLAPSSMQVARRGGSATALVDGRVLVVGGNDGTQDLASAEIFEPSTAVFSALDQSNHLSVPRSGHTALLLLNNNSVLVSGGQSNGVAVQDVDLFVPPIFPDPYTFGAGQFVMTSPMTAARTGALSGPAGDNGYAFVMGGGSGDAEVYRFATIKTDKDDYAPGEAATITGSGWESGEDVTLIFQEDPAVHDDYVLHVTADSQGKIFWNQWAPEQHDLNVRFYLTTVGSRSHAQITFTDSQPDTLTLNPASVSVTAGNNAVYPLIITKQGNNTACTLTLSAAYTGTAPAGTTFSFSAPNPVTMTTANVTSTLTITTTNSGIPATQTPPGTYPFVVTATRSSNCQGNVNNTVTGNGTLIVAGSTSLLASPATGTYGGLVSLSATLTSGSSGVSGKTINFTLNSNNVGTATTNASGVATLNGVGLAGINVGSYGTAVGASFAGDSSFLASSGTSSLTVARADATVSVSGFTGIYNGSAHGATGSATGASGEDLGSLLNLGATFIDAPGGTANWTFAGNTNYNAKSGSVNIVINQADAAVTVTGYTGVYDGSAHGASGSATGINSENLNTLLSFGLTFTNAPGGTANWTFAGNTNYNAKSGTVNIVINQADATVAVSGYSGIYDGNAHGASGTATGVIGENLNSLLSLGASFTNVPGGTANWTFAGNTNYSPKSGSVTVAISKADANISVTGYTGAYDGNAHSATGTATGVKSEDLSGLLSLGDSFTDAPGGTATWTFAGNTNYNAKSGSVNVVINKADATVTVTGYTGVYDGYAHGATGSATGVKGEDLSALLSLGASFTNVPGGTANWSFAGNTNYNSTSGSVAIVLSRASQIISWATPAAIVYGTPLSGTQLNAVVTKGDGALTYAPPAGTVLSVGQQTLQVSAAQTQNYNAASMQVTLEVKPWYLTGFYNPVTMGGSQIVNTVKGGSTVPLKFNMYQSNGGTELTSTSDVKSFQVYGMTCGASAYEDPVDITTTGGTSLRYDTTGRQFIQNWQTPRGAGACYQVTMTASDGSSIVAFFKMK